MTDIAFTGHRPDKLGGYGPSDVQQYVREAISDQLHILKPACVISGMALGVDQWAAEEAMVLGIPVFAAIPFLGQESQWPEESQRRYRELLSKCAMQHIVSPGGYTREKMQVRNEFMVDECDILIAVWDGSSGGTANCVRYAKRKQKKMIRIDPRLTTKQ